MTIRLLLVLASLLIFPFSGASASSFLPHSPWNIDYGKTSCDLKRIFKSGEDNAQLQITQSFNIGGGTFYLVLKPLSKKRYWKSNVKMLIEETGAEFSSEGQFLRIREENLLVLQIHQFDMTFLENLPDEVTLRLENDRYPDLTLKLTGMNAVDTALKECQRNLYKAFGLADEQIDLLSKRPTQKKKNARLLLDRIGYPSQALQNEHQGNVTFLLEVGADGRVKNCTIVGSSGHKSLDDPVCQLSKKHARFEPALNKQGEPVDANFVGTIKFTIPN